MHWQIPVEASAEFAAAFLQAALTIGLAILCAWLHRTYRKPYFLYWALAWWLYSLRLVAIVSFLMTEARIWLYWHQVVTGLTALVLLFAAFVFAQGTRLRPAHLWFLAFPVVWSYVAIYRLNNFLLAAGPAVLFLSGATMLTGWAFHRHRRQTGSAAAGLLAATFLLWGLHHLDYPFLRARGVWTPWGYYLDIAFLLAAGLGILLLVQEDLNRGLRTLSSLSAVVRTRRQEGDVLDELLRRLLTLPAVRGGAMVFPRADGPHVLRGVGACSDWTGHTVRGGAAEAVGRALGTGRPEVIQPGHENGTAGSIPHAWIAALPILDGGTVHGALVVVGEARDPFAALDQKFLLALGQQIGAVLANAELTRRLAARTRELERLAARMVRQHEDERRRLSRELHDETAQVLAAVNMQIGIAREGADARQRLPLDRALALIGDGIRGIRRVTEHLRPSLLDDLGLQPALRALVEDFRQNQAIAVTYEAPERLPALSDEAELALFRALQEALSNVARHAGAGAVDVTIVAGPDHLRLSVRDDGRGLGDGLPNGASEHTGIVGMRERIQSLGGTVDIAANVDGPGVHVTVALPLNGPAVMAGPEAPPVVEDQKN